MEGLIDRSRRPIHIPRATKPEVLAKIFYLRLTYHFGPLKIMVYLERNHDVHVSRTGIWRILAELGQQKIGQENITRGDFFLSALYIEM